MQNMARAVACTWLLSESEWAKAQPQATEYYAKCTYKCTAQGLWIWLAEAVQQAQHRQPKNGCSTLV